MPSAPSRLNHPTFGPCDLVPSMVAIKWASPVPSRRVNSALSALSLAPANETPKMAKGPSGSKRDPRAANINNSETLTWASGRAGRRPTDAALRSAAGDSAVEWIAPVYRARAAEKTPHSYFAVNPKVLLLTADAAGAVGDLNAIDGSISVNEVRSQLLKGYLVLDLPNGNAIEVAQTIAKTIGDQAAATGVLFENIPYISPLCTCSCAGTTAVAPYRDRCAPAIAAVTPNDTFYTQQWGLQRINAPSAWPISEGDPNVVIAVLDQGVELGHPDLNLWPVSYSTVTHTNNGSPVGNHGTACAGIIGAKIDNAIGVAGLAGKCRVMAIATNFADTEVAEGLYFAADNGARVVSMSFGVYPSWMLWNFAIIEAALQYCVDKNVVLVAASGNENQNVCRFPGSDPRTLCVGGSNRADVRKAVADTSVEPFWGACYGPSVDVVAPCLEIPTTDRLGAAGYTPTDYDMTFNGTSSATPHVAGLAGLIISVNPSSTASDVRKIISETTDKINLAGYTYLPTPGKPYGTWTNEVGYGRINVERALLVACRAAEECRGSGPCGVALPRPDDCCVSPCDPPWRPDQQCLFWYETRFLRVPLSANQTVPRRTAIEAAAVAVPVYIEFRITYQHKLCLLGKQHGPLLYTVTLLPGEKVTLYHSERYRHITSSVDRFSVQTTFMQYLSLVHQARVTGTLDTLNETLGSSKSASAAGGGVFLGIINIGGGTASSSSVTTHTMTHVNVVADEFNQSVFQASQLTHAERSVVISTYDEKETADITARVIQNDNACRAVTYFVRKVVELYAVSTVVTDVSYRIVAPNFPSDWHAAGDIAWLPVPVQNQIKAVLALLPKVGQVIDKPMPVSIPTDGVVYDPELAHCCSCEPERAAAIEIQLEKQKAEALKACLDAQMLEVELQRRRMLLEKGELGPFETAAAAAPAPAM